MVLIHYFGFVQADVIAYIRKHQLSLIIIEDISHALFTRADAGIAWGDADVTVASLRKLLPLPDGGYAVFNDAVDLSLLSCRTSFGHLSSVSCRFVGSLLKAIWLRYPVFSKSVFRCFFQWGEEWVNAYPKPAPMSVLSRFLLKRFDWSECVRRRQRNYAFLACKLKGLPGVQMLYPNLPAGVCPLGLPILCGDRDKLATHLIDNRIYSPVHWELPDSVERREFADAWFVSDRILTLPIDQRYDLKDMSRIADVMASYWSNS